MIVTLMLFLATVLTALFVNRNLVFEQRASANQLRSTQAFEAAEAGLEWALAQLNNPQRIGADCQTSVDSAASSFRERYLSFARDSAVFTPNTWMQGGTLTPLRPTCVRSAAAWSCSCPADGAPALSTPTGRAPSAAFTLQFLPGDKAGIVRVVATGCTSLAGVCLPGSTAGTDATARIEVAFGLHAGLRTPPVAALTTRGAFSANAASIGVHNPDPATGIAIHAGAGIAAAQARLTGPAGSAPSSALVGGDSALAALNTDQFFARSFGIDKTAWRNQPAVTRITCTIDCAAALTAAITAVSGNAMIWIDGDLVLNSPLTLGTPAHPVLIVVDGMARLDGAVALIGVIYSASMTWSNTNGGAFVRGTALTEGDYQGDGAPEFFYDAGVLATLAGNSGSFARVSGSWRDF